MIEQFLQLVPQIRGEIPAVLTLIGYKNSDDERTEHMQVVPWRGDLYAQLLGECLATADIHRGRGLQHGFDDATWAAATVAMVGSWQLSLGKILNGTAVPRKETQFSPDSDYPGILVEKVAGNIHAIALDNLLLLQSSAPTTDKDHRTDLTAAKATIRKLSPMSRFLGRMIIRTGKVEAVTLHLSEYDYPKLVALIGSP